MTNPNSSENKAGTNHSDLSDQNTKVPKHLVLLNRLSISIPELEHKLIKINLDKVNTQEDSLKLCQCIEIMVTFYYNLMNSTSKYL